MVGRLSSPVFAYVGLVTAMVFWASSFVALKLAFRGYDPMVVIFGRMAIASLCFAFFIKRLTKGVVFRKKDLKYILFMAVCEPCSYFMFEGRARENTTAYHAGRSTS